VNASTLRATVACVALALLATASFFACFEQKLTEVDTLASAQARENPYLALSRLLERMGYEVELLDGPGSLDDAPPRGATLLLTNTRDTLSDRRAAPLLAWVATGGHLVTSLQGTWDEETYAGDPLIDPLGLFGADRRHRDRDEQGEGDAYGGVAEGGEPADAMAAPSESPTADDSDASVLDYEEVAWDVTQAEIDGVVLEANLRPWWWWEEPADVADWVAEGTTGAHIVRVSYGDGQVTALSDDGFARNDSIGERDHAELWLRLIGPAREGAPVWIVVGQRWPGLLSQVLDHAAAAGLSGVVLLAAWLWHAMRRFGPIAPDPPTDRRRWLEHLDAVGRFHWRRDRAADLIRELRAGLEDTIARARPGWRRLSAAERHQRISETSGLSAVQVALALDPSNLPTHESEAVRTIARIEKIRGTL